MAEDLRKRFDITSSMSEEDTYEYAFLTDAYTTLFPSGEKWEQAYDMVSSFFGTLPRLQRESVAYRILSHDMSVFQEHPELHEVRALIEGKSSGSKNFKVRAEASLKDIEREIKNVETKQKAKQRSSSNRGLVERIAKGALRETKDAKGRMSAARAARELKNPQAVLDRLYREASRLLRLNRVQSDMLYAALGRGPLRKKGAAFSSQYGKSSKALNAALIDIIKQNGQGGVATAAQIVSIIAGDGASGLKFDKDGNPTNLRQIFDSTGQKIPGSIKSMISKDLTEITREAALVMKEEKLPAPKALAKALENLRTGKARTVAQVRKTKEGKTIRLKGGKLRETERGTFKSSGSPVHVEDAAGAIAKWEADLAKSLSPSAKNSFASAFLSALAEQSPKLLKEIAGTRNAQIAKGIKRAKESQASLARVNAAREALKGSLYGLSRVVDRNGVTHTDPISSFRAMRDDLEAIRKQIANKGPAYLETAEGRSLLGAAGAHLQNLQELKKFLSSKGYQSLNNKERGLLWGSQGGEIAKAVQIASDNKTRKAIAALPQSDRSLFASFRSLVDLAPQRGSAALISEYEKLLRGEIQFRKERKILTPREILERDRPKFREGMNRYIAVYGKALGDLVRGKSIKGKYKHPISKAPIETVKDLLTGLDITYGRAGGKFASTARRLFLEENKEARKIREFAQQTSSRLYADFDKAVADVTSSPTAQNVERVRAAASVLQSSLPDLHKAFLAFGGKEGAILYGTNEKEIQKSVKTQLTERGSIAASWLRFDPSWKDFVSGDKNTVDRNLHTSLKYVYVSEEMTDKLNADIKAAIKENERTRGPRLALAKKEEALRKSTEERKRQQLKVSQMTGSIGAAKTPAAKQKARLALEKERLKLKGLREKENSLARQVNSKEAKSIIEQNRSADAFLKKLQSLEGQVELGYLEKRFFEKVETSKRSRLSPQQKLAALLSGEASRYGVFADTLELPSIAKMLGGDLAPKLASNIIKETLTSLKADLDKIISQKDAPSAVSLMGMSVADARAMKKAITPKLAQQAIAAGSLDPFGPQLAARIGVLPGAYAPSGLGPIAQNLAVSGATPEQAAIDAANAAKEQRRLAREAKKSPKVEKAVAEATDAVAQAAGEAVQEQVKKPSTRRSAATAAAPAAVAAVQRAAGPVGVAAGGAGGGGGGGRRRPVAAAPGGGGEGVPSVGGKNIQALSKNAAAISQIMGALGTIAPVPQKKLADLRSSIRGIAEMMAELKGVSGGRISAKGLASAITSQAAAVGAGVVGKGGKGVGGGDGGGTKRLIGYALPGSQDLREQEQNIGKFAQKTEGILGRFVDQIKFGFSQQIVGQISQGVGALLAHLQGGIIGFNAQLENSTVAFQTLFENEQTAMGAISIDVKKATDQAQTMVSSIQNFANITPFRFPELVESARRMRAFGFETEEILPNLQSIGDAVAALGGEDDKLNRITYALGQMKQSGRVYQNDMMQLANAGIAGYDLLARAVIKNLVKTGDASVTYLGQKIEAIADEADANKIHLTVDGVVEDTAGARALTVAANMVAKEGLAKSGVQLKATSKAAADAVEAINLIATQGPVQAMRTLAKRGKILGQDASRAIIAEMAAQFRGGMDKLSKTFKGALSTLQDTSQYMVALITKPIYDGVRDAMYQAGQFFQSRAARNMAKDFADTFASTLPTIGGILSDTASILGSFVKGVQELGGKILSFGSGVGQASSIIDMFRDGISAIATMMQNHMVRAAVVAAAAIKVFSMAFSANPMLLAITAIITGLGMLSRVYEENTFGMQDTINKYVAPMQGIVANIQQNIVPVLMKIGEGFASIFQGGVLVGINAVLPALTIFLKLLNALLEIINRITPAANVLGAALSVIVAKKVFGGALFGQKAAFDASGNMIRAASGGLLGSVQRGVGGVVSSMGGTIARQDIYQQGFKATQAAKSNTALIRAQTSAARSVLQGAVAKGAMSKGQMDDVLKVFGEKLQSIISGSKNVKEARAALIRGGEFGRVVEAVMKTGRVAASTSDTAASIRLGNAARDIRTAANGFGRSIGNFISGVKMFVGVLPKLAQSLASVAKGGSFLPGSALLPLAGEWGKKGIGGTIQARLRNVAGQGLGLAGRAVGKIGIAQGASGLLQQGVKSFGKLGGALSLLGVGMDVASGVDPMRAGLRGGLGFGGSAIGAAAGSIFGPLGTILGGMAGGFIGSSIGDLLSDIMGISKETTQINQDLSEAEIKQRAWNAATADGVLTYQELTSITDSAMVTVEELANQIQLVNGTNIGGTGRPAVPTPSISPESTLRELTAGLGLTQSEFDRNLKLVQLFTDGARGYYENLAISKMNILEKDKQVDAAGNLINQNAINRTMALAQAEIILMLTQQGAITSTEQLNQVIQTIAGKFDLTGDALKKYNLLTSAGAGNTEKLSDALSKAQERLSALQRRFQLASSALENRISMIFEKEMAKALEKAKDAFLETQTVMVEGFEWNLLALRKEIEEQEKKNRLLQIEKNLREATMNVEMARLALYDASVDPLEAAARLREAEEAKTEAVRSAALERKKIALDEAMASTPIKEGLEQIEEYFDAARLKFQEGMANILRLLEEGKISGEEAMDRIRALYTTTFSELGILDKSLEADAQSFGDGFLNSWDQTVSKFIKLADKVAALLKRIKSLQKEIKDASTGTGDTATTPTTTSGVPQNSESTLGGRAYDNWRGHGYALANQMEAQVAAQMKQVDANMKAMVRLKYNKLFAAFSKVIAEANSGAIKIPYLYRESWDNAISKATGLFAPKGALNNVFVESNRPASSWTTLLPRLNQGVISLKSMFTNQPVNPFKKFSTGLSSTGFASGGTIMGPGIFRVGEAGTETMQVTPFGVARVFPRTYRPINGISAVGGSTSGAVNASVIINNPTVRNDQDIRKLAEEVSRAQRSLLRSSGVGRI